MARGRALGTPRGRVPKPCSHLVALIQTRPPTPPLSIHQKSAGPMRWLASCLREMPRTTRLGAHLTRPSTAGQDAPSCRARLCESLLALLGAINLGHPFEGTVLIRRSFGMWKQKACLKYGWRPRAESLRNAGLSRKDIGRRLDALLRG